MKYLHTNMLIVDFPPDMTDIADGLVFEGDLFEDIREGTAIVPRVRLAEGVYLKVVSEEEDGSWMAWWHDRKEQSPYSGMMFRIEPVGASDEDGLPHRIFRVLLQPDRDLEEGEAVAESGLLP